MKITLVAFMAICFLASCNNDSSGNNVPPKSTQEVLKEEADKLQNAESARDVTDALKPEAYQTIKENLSYEDLKKFNKQGCTADGSYKLNLDPELKKGSKFRRHNIYSKAGRNTENSIMTTEVTEVTPTVVKSHENYELFENSSAPNKPIAEIFSATPHFISQTTYNFSGDQNEPLATYDRDYPNLTPAGMQYLSQIYSDETDTYWICHVESRNNGQDIYQSKADEIKYPILGATVSAYVQTRKQTGVVKCTIYASNSNGEKSDETQIELGLGTEEVINIYSNALVQKEFTRCGGDAIYSASRIKLESGRILTSRAEKVLAAPFRAQAN